MSIDTSVRALSVLALAALVGCANQATSAATSTPTSTPASAPAHSAAPKPTPLATPQFVRAGASGAIADVVEKVLPSVVSVSSSRTRKAPRVPWQFFGPEGAPREFRQQGLGSGVVIDEGVVVTNNHVVEDADEIKVTTADKREFVAKVVGTDPKSDLAVLKVDAPPGTMTPLPFGDSARLRLGDVVLAIGNPFGVGQTVTMGIVSAKGRADVGIVDYEDFIQTDAAINPGNSGGALVDSEGNLIGVNTAILSRTGGNMGIGFAIPSNMAKPIVDSLLQHGRVVRGFLGVNIQDVDQDLANAMGVKEVRGVLVSDVHDKSPAAAAGIKRGDIVLSIDGRRVDTTGQLRNLVAAAGAKRSVAVQVLRDDKTKTLTVTLGEMPNDMSRHAKGSPASDALDGATLQPLDASLRQRFHVPDDVKAGVVVVDVDAGSAASRAGLRPGDVVLEVNRHKVRTLDDFKRVYERAKGRVLLLVHRGEGTIFLVVRR